MNRDEIKSILPHREPMLLIDEVELVDRVAVGKYTVRGDEFFLQGHFPQKPVVPGVILCEMMAQTCCVLLSDIDEKFTPYFTGLNNVKFKNKVEPGKMVIFKCNIIKQKGSFYFANGQGFVNEKLCVSGEFSFAVIRGE